MIQFQERNKDESYKTPLLIALENKSLEFAKYLIKHGAHCNLQDKG